MTVHNYRLICPNGLFFTHGEICEECAGGHEFRCIVNNCENSRLKSAGYAGRNWWARKQRYYLDHVDAFLCLTEFQKMKLVKNGYQPDKIFVIPNTMECDSLSTQPHNAGGPVGFAGRISLEKGALVLLSAAIGLPNIQFKLAGAPDPDVFKGKEIPQNFQLAGRLDRMEIETFYQNISLLIVPSIWYEGFPMVILEAMKHHLPVIAPNMAGFPEIIEDGVTGLLFEPGNAADLADKINTLWNDHQRCSAMGEQGFRRLSGKYSAEAYYSELMKIYSNVTMDAKQ